MKDIHSPLLCTVGGKWYEGATPIMAQVSCGMGHGVAIPLTVNLCARIMAGDMLTGKFRKVDRDGIEVQEEIPVIEYPEGSPWKVAELIINDKAKWDKCLQGARQIVPFNKTLFKRLMEGRIHPVIMTGQNFKYDIHVCRNFGINIDTECWEHDTLQLAFVMDENIMSKDLASITKIWVPALSGYSDEFEQTVDYAHMDQVEHDKIMHYGCADCDTVYRLTKRLVPDAMQDARHYNCYERIQMPALRMFVDVEARGTKIDLSALRKLGDALTKDEADRYEELIGSIHPDIRRKFLQPNKNRHGLNFTRRVIIVDHLFEHPKGLKLTPKLFTPRGPPTTSSKHHLPYFEDEPWVSDFMEWEKINTLLTKFVGGEAGENEDGDDEEASGIWEYIAGDGCIHPSYWLHRTVTGRTASSDTLVV